MGGYYPNLHPFFLSHTAPFWRHLSPKRGSKEGVNTPQYTPNIPPINPQKHPRGCRLPAGSLRMTGRPCALRSLWGLAMLAPSTPKADQKTAVRPSIFGAEMPQYAPYGRRMGSRCSPCRRRLCPPLQGRPDSRQGSGRRYLKKAPQGLFLGLSKPFAVVVIHYYI